MTPISWRSILYIWNSILLNIVLITIVASRVLLLPTLVFSSCLWEDHRLSCRWNHHRHKIFVLAICCQCFGTIKYLQLKLNTHRYLAEDNPYQTSQQTPTSIRRQAETATLRASLAAGNISTLGNHWQHKNIIIVINSRNWNRDWCHPNHYYLTSGIIDIFASNVSWIGENMLNGLSHVTEVRIIHITMGSIIMVSCNIWEYWIFHHGVFCNTWTCLCCRVWTKICGSKVTSELDQLINKRIAQTRCDHQTKV